MKTKTKLKIEITTLIILYPVLITVGLSLCNPHFSYLTYKGALINSASIFMGIYLIFGSSLLTGYLIARLIYKLTEKVE